VSLSAGEYYKIQGQHIEYTSSEHFTASVEIDQVPPEAVAGVPHPQTMRQEQKLAIEHVTYQQEQWHFQITDMDSGEYKLNFLNPTTSPPSIWQSSAIKANSNYWTVRSAIYGYYSKYWGSSVSVTLTYFGDDGTEYTSSSDANVTTWKYTVTCDKLIDGYSANSITVSKIDTAANIVVTPPQNGKMSTPPLSGKYTITCTDPDGTEWTTANIDYTYH